MSLSPKDGFHLLKTMVTEQVKDSLSIRKDIKDWSIQDIQDFQIDLEAKCQSSVSEKWIYTHFKNENEKLPRVDVLNLLSRYCGYKTWEVFLYDNNKVKITKRPRKYLLSFSLGILSFLIVLVTLWYSFQEKSQIVIFQDAYTQRILNLGEIDIELKGKKNHTSWKKGEKGIKILKQTEDSLIVNGPYYKNTKFMVSDQSDTVIIKLLPDDYALMLNYFSRSDIKNIAKRENQLEQAIHDEAKIFQVYEEFEGLELLNKTEFIDRLILPVNYLKNLEILDIQYKEEQIFRLRFRQNKTSNE